MILGIFAFLLIIGFIAADAMLDYIFVLIYALVVAAVLDGLISVVKLLKKNDDCSVAIWQIIIFICIGIGAYLIQDKWL